MGFLDEIKRRYQGDYPAPPPVPPNPDFRPVLSAAVDPLADLGASYLTDELPGDEYNPMKAAVRHMVFTELPSMAHHGMLDAMASYPGAEVMGLPAAAGVLASPKLMRALAQTRMDPMESIGRSQTMDLGKILQSLRSGAGGDQLGKTNRILSSFDKYFTGAKSADPEYHYLTDRHLLEAMDALPRGMNQRSPMPEELMYQAWEKSSPSTEMLLDPAQAVSGRLLESKYMSPGEGGQLDPNEVLQMLGPFRDKIESRLGTDFGMGDMDPLTFIDKLIRQRNIGRTIGSGTGKGGYYTPPWFEDTTAYGRMVDNYKDLEDITGTANDAGDLLAFTRGLEEKGLNPANFLRNQEFQPDGSRGADLHLAFLFKTIQRLLGE